MANDSKYPLNIEILKDYPCCSLLKKGQICKARLDKHGDFFVFDDDNNATGDWRITGKQAKEIS